MQRHFRDIRSHELDDATNSFAVITVLLAKAELNQANQRLLVVLNQKNISKYHAFFLCHALIGDILFGSVSLYQVPSGNF